MLPAIQQAAFRDDQHSFLYNGLFGNPVFCDPGSTRFQDLMDRSYEISKGPDEPEGPTRMQRWRRVLRTTCNNDKMLSYSCAAAQQNCSSETWGPSQIHFSMCCNTFQKIVILIILGRHFGLGVPRAKISSNCAGRFQK